MLSNVCDAATIYTEMGDAGGSIATAQSTTNSTQTFDQIQGSLSPTANDSVDIYKIYATGGGNFSAQTIGGVAFDSELFLFDSSGKGVYSNDDTITFLSPSVLPANNALTPRSAGYYFLAITQCCYQPFSSAGPIFQYADGNQATNLLLSGPTGSGGALPLSYFSGAFDQTPGGGAYTIFLTGASLAVDNNPPPVDNNPPPVDNNPPPVDNNPTSVPEPSTWVLVASSIAGAGFVTQRRSLKR